MLHYAGNWTTLNDPQIPSTDDPKPYVETSDALASVSADFTGAVAVAINANRNWGHWLYKVVCIAVTLTCSSSLIVYKSLNDTAVQNVDVQYNASTYWLIGNALLYYQSGLNPSTGYSIMLTNLGNSADFKLSLNDITIYLPNTTNSLARYEHCLVFVMHTQTVW